MNSANFHDQPTAGMYWIAFLAYALQLPSTPDFSQNIHPTSQSISYVWFIKSNVCSLPMYFFCTSSSMYRYSFEFDHQSAMNTISEEKKQTKSMIDNINYGFTIQTNQKPEINTEYQGQYANFSGESSRTLLLRSNVWRNILTIFTWSGISKYIYFESLCNESLHQWLVKLFLSNISTLRI